MKLKLYLLKQIRRCNLLGLYLIKEKEMRYVIFMSVAVAGLLIGCGEGGGSSGHSTPAVSNKKISGYVLDGPINNANVCIDINGDKQCNDDEPGTTTSNDGQYSFEYSSDIEIDEYEVIADVRHEKVSDSDYSNDKINYDYVLTAFDNKKEEVNLSPLSSYLNFQKKITQKTDEEILQETSTLLESYEEYEYESVEVTEYMTSNYIEYEQSSDEDISKLNKNLHNLNEVLARNMQQSQMQWEKTFAEDVNLDSSDWYDNSQMIIENSQYNVFRYFEEITEVVETYSYTETFNAEIASSYFEFGKPNARDIQEVLDYMSQEQEKEKEASKGESYSGIIEYYLNSVPNVKDYIVYNGTQTQIYAYGRFYDGEVWCQSAYDMPVSNFVNGDKFIKILNSSGYSARYVNSIPSACNGSSSHTISDPSKTNNNVSKFPPKLEHPLPKPMPQMILSPVKHLNEPTIKSNLASGGSVKVSNCSGSSCLFLDEPPMRK